MRKGILIAVGWGLCLLTLIFTPKVAKNLTPKIIIKEIPYIKEVEKIVEKPVYKGEKIIEKIVYKPTPVEMFKITKTDTMPSDPFKYI